MTAVRSVLLAAALTVSCSRAGEPAATAAAPDALEVLGSVPGVAMAKIALGPGESFLLHASRCQDVSVLVDDGAVQTSPSDARLAKGSAARFTATTTLRADAEQGAQVFAATVLSSAAGFESVDWTGAPQSDACPKADAPQVTSDPERSGPFMHAGGRLAVMIYLDSFETDRPVPSLGTLRGDAMLGVPEHTHETSAEVLWIEDGSGTMRVGNETRPIRPGTFVYVPPKTIHGFEPDGIRPLFAYQVYAPAGPEQRFRTSKR